MAKEQIDNPLRWLTRAITKADGKKPDIMTEFPTTEVLNLQLYRRHINRVYGIKEAKDDADDFADAMWSFKRSSRKEVVLGLHAGAREKRPFISEDMSEITIPMPEGFKPRRSE